MSRENKLALIIGFGLVLFVGVLISDHLSAAHRSVTADLSAAVDPLLDDEHAAIVEYEPVLQPLTPAPAAEEELLETPTPHLVLHTVQSEETLTSICLLYYRNGGYADALAAWNNLPDPRRLVPGTRLVMPDAHQLQLPDVRPTIATTPAPVQLSTITTLQVNSPELNIYTVKPGDTLSQIAQQLLGTSKATTQLYELNRDVLGDMDSLQVGMELRYQLPSS